MDESCNSLSVLPFFLSPVVSESPTIYIFFIYLNYSFQQCKKQNVVNKCSLRDGSSIETEFLVHQTRKRCQLVLRDFPVR